MILHFVLTIESENTFEVSGRVGLGENRINADDMHELAADLCSNQAPDFAVIASEFQGTIFEFTNRTEPPADSK